MSDLYDEMMRGRFEAKFREKDDLTPSVPPAEKNQIEERPSPEKDAERPMPRPTYTAPGLGPSGPGFYTNSRAWRPPHPSPASEPANTEEKQVEQQPERDLHVEFDMKAGKVEDLYDAFTSENLRHSARSNEAPTTTRETFAKDAKQLEDLYDSLIKQGDLSFSKSKEETLERQRQNDRGR